MTKLFLIVFLLGSASWVTAQQQSTTGRHIRPRPEAAKLQPGIAAARGTVASAQPSSPPVVSYQNGQLTIFADNAGLGEVVDRVRDSMAVVVDTPPLTLRVTAHLGPKPPAQVIAALLDGLHVNYVILGDLANSGTIRAIVIMPEVATGPETVPPPRPPVDVEAAAAKTKALVVAQTGGDEGVWDNVEVGVPAVPTPPATTTQGSSPPPEGPPL